MAVCALALAVACGTGSLMSVSAETVTESTAQDSTGNTASIHIKLKDVDTPMKGVLFDIYKLADYNPEDGTFAYDEEWGVTSLPDTSSGLDKLAEKLSKNIKGSRADTCKTNKAGEASLKTECGIYLLVPGETEKYGEVSPFILRLPYLEEVTGQETGWVYDTEVEPKVVPPEKTPEPTKEPESEQPQPTQPPSSSVKGTDDVKTGDYTNIAFLVLCLLLAGVNIGMITKKKEK